MIRIRYMVAGLVAALAACSSSDMATSTTTPAGNAVISADVAAVAADGVAEDVDVMAGMDGGLGNVTAQMGSGVGTGAALDDGDGSDRFRPGLTGCSFSRGTFRCPTEDNDGLTVTRTVTFLAGDGSTQSAFDSLLTASIHVVVDISGDRSHGRLTATIARHRDITISGLAGKETTRTVNGTGTEDITKSRLTRMDGTVRSYTLTGSFTITDVVLPVRSADGRNGFPLSGTVTRTFTVNVTAGPDSGKTFTRTVTITFNGTSMATGTVNGTPFTFDLVGHDEGERNRD